MTILAILALLAILAILAILVFFAILALLAMLYWVFWLYWGAVKIVPKHSTRFYRAILADRLGSKSVPNRMFPRSR